MTNFIENSNIDYWIYGHTHRNVNNKIGKCEMLSNQFGYSYYNENDDFNFNKIIEI
jgi:hypothetical protein